MGFKDQVQEEVEEANSSTDNGEREEVNQIELDMDSVPFIKFTPTTLVAGTFPEDEGNPIILFKNYNRINDDDFDAEDENGNDLRYVSTRYLGLVIDDPHVVTDEEDGLEESIFIETDEDDTTDFRALNLDDARTSEKGDSAINIDGDTYWYDDTHTELEGRAILVVDRTAHTSVAQKLDKNGAVAAGMDYDTGNVNDGLIEYPNDDDSGLEPRYSRPFVELRDELRGTEVGFMVTRRSEVDEEYAEAVESEDVQDMMWYSVFDMETGESIEPVEGEPTASSYVAWNFDPSAGRIPDDQYEFVEQYVEKGLPTDEDEIIEAVEGNAENFDSEPNEQRIVELVQAYA